MKTHKVLTLAGGLLIGLGLADVASAKCLVIDDFTTGPTQLRLTQPYTTADTTQSGNMLGGWRRTWLYLAPSRYRLPAHLKIGGDSEPDIPLVVTFPLESRARAEVIYGQGAPGAVLGGTVPPLAYYPTGCDRFRVHFNSAAAYNYINFNVLAWYQDEFPYYAQAGVNLQPFGLPFNFCVDFRFSSFVNTGRAGPSDVALQTRGIRALDFIFQNGGSGGAEELAISRIETVDAATAASRPCQVRV